MTKARKPSYFHLGSRSKSADDVILDTNTFFPKSSTIIPNKVRNKERNE